MTTAVMRTIIKETHLHSYISDLMQDVGSRIIQYIRVSLPKHTASHPE
jgi:hypothetical protein